MHWPIFFLSANKNEKYSAKKLIRHDQNQSTRNPIFCGFMQNHNFSSISSRNADSFARVIVHGWVNG